MYAGKFTDYTGYASTIADQVDCRAGLEKYGLLINKQGFALCPFHNEKTASMKVYNDSFHCFGCGRHGNVVNFVRDYYNINFFQAVEKINADFSLSLPIEKGLTVRSIKASNSMFKKLETKRRNAALEKELELDKYFALWDEWINLDKLKQMHAPKEGDERLHPNFVYALNNIELISYRIDKLPPMGVKR